MNFIGIIYLDVLSSNMRGLSSKKSQQISIFSVTVYRKKQNTGNLRWIYDALPTLDDILHIVNVGFLPHSVIWPKNVSIKKFGNMYYVRSHHVPNNLIVFNGNPELKHTSITLTAFTSYSMSTKQAESSHRTKSPNILTFQYQYISKILFPQDKLLSLKIARNFFFKLHYTKYSNRDSCATKLPNPSMY